MSWSNEESERVKAIEVVHAEHGAQLKEISDKLDQLIELKNKGLGAFWLASIIIGATFTAIIAFVTNIVKV